MNSRIISARAAGARCLLALAAITALLLTAFPAPAQVPAAAAQPAPGSEVSTADLEALVATLGDEAEREKLLSQLRALLETRRAVAPEPETPALGAQVLNTVSEQVEELGTQMVAAAEFVIDLPRAFGWLRDQITDPAARARWVEALVKAVLVLATGFVAQLAAGWLLRRPRRAVETRHEPRLLVRAAFLLIRTVLDLLPVLAFAAVAYAVLPLLSPRGATRLAVLAIVNANVAMRLVVAFGRMLLAPDVPALRLPSLADQTAQYLFLWVRRLAAISIYGYVTVQVLHVFGASNDAYNILLKLLGLIVAVLLVVIVLQNRAYVADRLRAGTEGRGGYHMLRARVADVWHVFAIAYIAAVYVIWALQVDDGFELLFRATLLTAVILVAARLAVGIVRGAMRRGFALSGELRQQYPTLEAHANRYLPILQHALVALIWVVAALALLEAWGFDAFGWIASETGTSLLGALIKIALLLFIGVIAWELVRAAAERYARRADVASSARMRTLMPLLQRITFVVLTTVIGLTVLAEIGIDIGPLLAGAGIVGLAVGFGAQTLVKDIITGIFILLEDQFSVGDVINAGGKGGLVEAISIRTIRLRDYDGTVHVVPYSEIGTTSNLTKEFSYYVFDIRVAYREDIDQVIEVLKGVAQEMIDDPEFGPKIIPPFEVAGVDKLDESAVIVKCRIKTLPIQQWTTGREFNRRLKKRFDELGIQIPFPHRTLYFGTDKQGDAPPARIALDDRVATLAEAAAQAKSGDGRGRNEAPAGAS